MKTWQVTGLTSTTAQNQPAVGSVILWGLFNDTTTGNPPRLADIEVRVDWKGVRGKRAYSIRTMYSRDQ